MGLLAFLLGLTLLVWTATGLAGLFAHGSWPDGCHLHPHTHGRYAIWRPSRRTSPAPGRTTPAQLSGYGLFWGLFIGQLMVAGVLTVFVVGTVTRARAVRAARRSDRSPSPTPEPQKDGTASSPQPNPRPLRPRWTTPRESLPDKAAAPSAPTPTEPAPPPQPAPASTPSADPSLAQMHVPQPGQRPDNGQPRHGPAHPRARSPGRSPGGHRGSRPLGSDQRLTREARPRPPLRPEPALRHPGPTPLVPTSRLC